MESGTKKSKLKIIIPIVIAIVVIAVVVGIVIIKERGESSIKAPENIEVLDWEKAINEYGENPARAQEKYKGNWYEYTGVVTDLYTNKCNMSSIVTLNYYNYKIEVTFKDKEALKTLNKGDELTIIGKLTTISDSFTSKITNAEIKEVKSTGNTFYIK